MSDLISALEDKNRVGTFSIYLSCLYRTSLKRLSRYQWPSASETLHSSHLLDSYLLHVILNFNLLRLTQCFTFIYVRKLLLLRAVWWCSFKLRNDLRGAQCITLWSKQIFNKSVQQPDFLLLADCYLAHFYLPSTDGFCNQLNISTVVRGYCILAYSQLTEEMAHTKQNVDKLILSSFYLLPLHRLNISLHLLGQSGLGGRKNLWRDETKMNWAEKVWRRREECHIICQSLLPLIFKSSCVTALHARACKAVTRASGVQSLVPMWLLIEAGKGYI